MEEISTDADDQRDNLDSNYQKFLASVSYWAGISIGVTMLYVLSLGPLVYLVEKDIIREDNILPLLETIYAPLESLYFESESFATSLDWYLEVWR